MKISDLFIVKMGFALQCVLLALVMVGCSEKHELIGDEFYEIELASEGLPENTEAYSLGRIYSIIPKEGVSFSVQGLGKYCEYTFVTQVDMDMEDRSSSKQHYIRQDNTSFTSDYLDFSYGENHTIHFIVKPNEANCARFLTIFIGPFLSSKVPSTMIQINQQGNIPEE